MSKRQFLRGKASVQNWPFQPPSFDRDFILSPLEKTALATWKAQGQLDKKSRKIDHKTKQQLNRLTQPIEAALLYYGISAGQEVNQQACVLLLLHEMHRRQTSLWAWDDSVWIEIVCNRNKEFKSIHHAFELAHNISVLRYRSLVMACAYLLSEIPIYQLVTDYSALTCAQHIFGVVTVKKAIQVLTTESIRIGRGLGKQRFATCAALLANRSPNLEKLTLPILEKVHETYSHHKALKHTCVLVSILLHNLKIIPYCLSIRSQNRSITIGKYDILPVDSANLIQAWYDTSTESEGIRKRRRGSIAKAARWAAEKYPGTTSAQQWTKSMAIAYVADVTRLTAGEWQHPMIKSTPKRGQPLKAYSKMALLADLRTFFRDCHEWGWFPISFNPDRYLATPKSVLAKRRPNPRPIAPAIWTKLQKAGLSLTKEDLPIPGLVSNAASDSYYPLEMVRAMAIVWLYVCNSRQPPL